MLELFTAMRNYAEAYEREDDFEGIETKGNKLASYLKESGVAAYKDREGVKYDDHLDYLAAIARISVYEYGNPESTAAAKKVIDEILKKDPDVEDVVDIHIRHQKIMDLEKIDPQIMRRCKRTPELFNKALKLLETLNGSIENMNVTEGTLALMTLIRHSDATSIQDDFKIAKKVFGDHGLSEKDVIILESLEKLSKSLMWKPELMEDLEPLDVPKLDKKMMNGSRAVGESMGDFVSRYRKNIDLLDDLERRGSSATRMLLAHYDSVQKAMDSCEQMKREETALKEQVLHAAKEILKNDSVLSPPKRAVLQAMPAIVEGRGNLTRQFRDLACG